jgi:hypothetical protein
VDEKGVTHIEGVRVTSSLKTKMTNYLNANLSGISTPHKHLSLITGAFMALNSPSLMEGL